MRARKRLAGSSHRFLDLVPLPLRSQPHSTALASLKRYNKRYEDRCLSEERNPLSFIYYKAKRCMLVSMKLAADFSAGCALSVIRLAFLLTHPLRLTLRELTPANATISKGERG